MGEIQQLRELASNLRRLADAEPNPAVKAELLDLASRCEAMANHLSGNGARKH